MIEPLRNDWTARAEQERQTREAIEECGPMSMGEGFYLARRAEGMGDMEARLATRTRNRWPPRAGVRGPRLTADEVSDFARGVTPQS